MSSLHEQADNKVVRKLPRVGIIIIVGVAALILLAIGSGFLLSPPWRYGIWIGVALVPGLYRFSRPLTYLSRKSHAGAILRNLGYLNKRAGRDTAGWIFTAIVFIVLWLITPSREPALVIFQFGVVVLYIANAASLIIANGAPTLITEKGIYSPEGTFFWNKVESRQWLNRDEHALLILKMKWWPWPLDEKTMKVPSTFKADVDRILREKGVT